MVNAIQFINSHFLSWAVTARKAQGQTLEKVSIDIGSSAFAHGAFYVAMSRVRKLEDILFFGVPKWPENGIVFHTNDYIQQQTRAIIDEAAHVYALNVGDENGSNNHQEEDNFLSEFTDDEVFINDNIDEFPF